jgi:Fe-S-cluster containining protein
MADHQEITLALRVGGEQVRLRARIPQGPITLVELLPVLWSLTELTTGVAARAAAGMGRPVRCGPSCGACCRQLVPIAPAEALALREVVAEMEPQRRAAVEGRFAAAAARLHASGLADRLGATAPGAGTPTGQPAAMTPDRRRDAGLRYFGLGIPCPFLEQESCGIHPHRPLACREYLVSSDPSHCSRPSADDVAVIDLPRRLSMLLITLGAELSPDQPRWLPMTFALAPQVFDAEAVGDTRRPGPELFERVVSWLVHGRAETGTPGQGAD